MSLGTGLYVFDLVISTANGGKRSDGRQSRPCRGKIEQNLVKAAASRRAAEVQLASDSPD